MASFYLSTSEASTPQAQPVRARGPRRAGSARGARDGSVPVAVDRTAPDSGRRARGRVVFRPASSGPEGCPARCCELRDLVKHYPAVGGETVRAVDGVSLSVAPGEMVVLYGPERFGQDHAVVDDRHAARADQRGGADRRARRRLALRARGLALPPLRARVHPPELRPAAGRHRDRQRGAEAAENDALARRPRPGRAAARAPGTRRAVAVTAPRPLDGRAPAGDDRARPLHASRVCCSPTSRPAASTAGAAAKCSNCCASSAASARSRSCSSATTRWPPRYADRVYALRDGKLGAYDPNRPRAASPESRPREAANLLHLYRVRLRARAVAGVLRDRRHRRRGGAAVRLAGRQLEPLELAWRSSRSGIVGNATLQLLARSAQGFAEACSRRCARIPGCAPRRRCWKPAPRRAARGAALGRARRRRLEPRRARRRARAPHLARSPSRASKWSCCPHRSRSTLGVTQVRR